MPKRSSSTPNPSPQRTEVPSTLRIRAYFFPLLLFVLVGIAYLPSLGNGFIWDDDAYVTNNLTLRTTVGLREIWLNPRATPQYYPVVHSTFWVEYHLWGVHPTGYHLTNILLHAANAILLYRVAKLLQIPGAELAALLFALHPVNVESVAWVTERKNVLSTLFYLLAFTAYLRFDTATGVQASRKRLLYGLSLGCLCLALLSKSVTASWPCAMLLAIFWLRKRIDRRDIVRLLPHFGIGILIALHTAWLEVHHVGANVVDLNWTMLERLQIAGRVPWFYLSKLAWPNPLIFIYPRWVIDASRIELWLGLLATVVLLAAAWGVRRVWGVGPLLLVLFYGGTLLPVLGFARVYPMRFSIVADHFQYLAAIGMFLLAGVGMDRLNRRLPRLRGLQFALATILVVVFIPRCWNQQADYLDEPQLWERTLDKNPDCYLAWIKQGLVAVRAGEVARAQQCFSKALELAPNSEVALHNLGGVLHEQGKDVEAARQFEKAIEVCPDDSQSYLALASLAEQRGEIDNAIEWARRGAKLPGVAAPLAMLGRLLVSQARIQEAREAFQQGLRVSKFHSATRIELAKLLRGEGKLDEAERLLQELLAYNPEDVKALHELGTLACVRKDYPRVLELTDRELNIAPGSLDALERISWLLSSSPDSSQRDPHLAIEISTTLQQFNSQSNPSRFFEVHADALAANSRFGDAIAALQELLKTVGKDQSKRARIERKLLFFNQGKLMLLDEWEMP